MHLIQIASNHARKDRQVSSRYIPLQSKGCICLCLRRHANGTLRSVSSLTISTWLRTAESLALLKTHFHITAIKPLLLPDCNYSKTQLCHGIRCASTSRYTHMFHNLLLLPAMEFM
eukprot:jgi/Botrbrau1/23067/Bobra.0243s0008.1